MASDIYTVGRTLAVLSLDVRGFSSTYADRLPDPAEAPLLAAEMSYHRLLRRATHPDPARRFQSAGEMREQLLGVLREVLSAADGVPRPAVSRQFTPERRAFGTDAGEVSPGLAGPGAGAPPGASHPPRRRWPPRCRCRRSTCSIRGRGFSPRSAPPIRRS